MGEKGREKNEIKSLEEESENCKIEAANARPHLPKKMQKKKQQDIVIFFTFILQ